MEREFFVVDWQRRRLLHTSVTSPSSCLHAVDLIHWCQACSDDLDGIAADLLPEVPSADTGSAA